MKVHVISYKRRSTGHLYLVNVQTHQGTGVEFITSCGYLLKYLIKNWDGKWFEVVESWNHMPFTVSYLAITWNIHGRCESHKANYAMRVLLKKGHCHFRSHCVLYLSEAQSKHTQKGLFSHCAFRCNNLSRPIHMINSRQMGLCVKVELNKQTDKHSALLMLSAGVNPASQS